MEPWPAVAWVLLLTVIADWLKTAQSKDFTEQDIIYLHPSTTPFPGGFKCFTCEEAPDNYECNRWAPDLYCPQESRYCYTRHMMNLEGDSLSVTKRCVALDDCLSTGCSEDHEGNKVCTACCEGNICNLPLPWNETEAVFATTSPLSGTAGLTGSYTLTSVFLTLLISSGVWDTDV
ncbi:ly6/PLAUR domain-containing protein 6 [Esox lucius]|uniref:LY6/PLAUR domain containing 6 n=1 Tax=Esox lucius TaxID=8010 RepID=A0A6Q2WT03_ESOLU|nr:ly6/PLAUR domain-containing protein 6 [Esox lucius]